MPKIRDPPSVCLLCRGRSFVLPLISGQFVASLSRLIGSAGWLELVALETGGVSVSLLVGCSAETRVKHQSKNRRKDVNDTGGSTGGSTQGMKTSRLPRPK